MIYLVVYGYYSDWQIYGYFTKLEDAEKYISRHKREDYYIEMVECLDENVDLSGISLKYQIPYKFTREEDSSCWNCETETEIGLLDNGLYGTYEAEFLRSNYIDMVRNGIYVIVNSTKKDLKLNRKVAQDLFYQYLDFCEGEPNEQKTRMFNSMLSKEEDERKERERQEKIKLKELKELERLKAKYEG